MDTEKEFCNTVREAIAHLYNHPDTSETIMCKIIRSFLLDGNPGTERDVDGDVYVSPRRRDSLPFDTFAENSFTKRDKTYAPLFVVTNSKRIIFYPENLQDADCTLAARAIFETRKEKILQFSCSGPLKERARMVSESFLRLSAPRNLRRALLDVTDAL